MSRLEKLTTGAQALGIELGPRAQEQFEAYFNELIAGNLRFNLTTITGYEEVQVRHFLDSLSLVLVLGEPVPESLDLLDVGSGAGFPGLPLKIAFPHWRVTLLEATAKKARFLEHLIAGLGLEGARVVVGRAEAVAHEPDFREGFSVVTSRGVAKLSTLAELTLPFCRVGGWVVAFKKGDLQQELAQAESAWTGLGGRLARVVAVEVPGLVEEEHKLVVITKVTSTPATYPRRPGIPAKRPLKDYV